MRRPRTSWFPVAVPIIIFFKRCATCVVQQLKDESSEGGGGGEVTKWYQRSDLHLKVTKTKEMLVDLGEKQVPLVDMVNTFKYLGDHQRPGVA